MNCSCSKLSLNDNLNTSTVVSHEWERDCEEHGIGSKWYEEIGAPKFAKQRTRTILLQQLAGQRRREEITLEEAKEKLRKLDEDER